MEVHGFDAPLAAMQAGIGGWPDLIDSVGTQSFERELYRFARDVTECQCLTVFADHFAGPPRTVVAASEAPLPIAWGVAAKYVHRYWDLDPVCGMTGQMIRFAPAVVVRVAPDDIDHSGYRQECYTSLNVVDRLSILQCRSDSILRINLYRTRSRGQFSPGEISAITQRAAMITALVTKHEKVDRPPPFGGTADAIAERMRSVSPGMPMRERHVCAGIARGLGPEAIAIALDLSVRTVLGNRRRAFERLKITVESDLTNLIFP